MALKISTSPSEDTLTLLKWNEAIKVAIVINIIHFSFTYTHTYVRSHDTNGHNKLCAHLSYKICQPTLSNTLFSILYNSYRMLLLLRILNQTITDIIYGAMFQK